MRSAKPIVGLLVVLVAVPVARGADTKPAEELAQLKRDLRTAIEVLDSGRKTGTTVAEKKVVTDRHFKRVGATARRALALAETYPEAPEAPEALVWITDRGIAAALTHLYEQAQLTDVRTREQAMLFKLAPRPPHIGLLDFAGNLIDASLAKGYREVHGDDDGGATQPPLFRKEVGVPHFVALPAVAGEMRRSNH